MFIDLFKTLTLILLTQHLPQIPLSVIRFSPISMSQPSNTVQARHAATADAKTIADNDVKLDVEKSPWMEMTKVRPATRLKPYLADNIGNAGYHYAVVEVPIESRNPLHHPQRYQHLGSALCVSYPLLSSQRFLVEYVKTAVLTAVRYVPQPAEARVEDEEKVTLTALIKACVDWARSTKEYNFVIAHFIYREDNAEMKAYKDALQGQGFLQAGRVRNVIEHNDTMWDDVVMQLDIQDAPPAYTAA